MTDKLTDKEIVKEFQLRTLKAEHPGFILCGQIVDLINRLQAENERLKDLCADCSMLKGKIETISDLQKQIEYWQRGYNDLRQELKTAKAEAYKEFWEKLWELDPEIISKVVSFDLDELNKLKKELVGENNETKTF